MADPQKPLVCLGVVAGAHGVKGLVKVKPFTEAPEGLAAYGPLRDESGEVIEIIEACRGVGEPPLGEINGITNREGGAVRDFQSVIERMERQGRAGS